MQLNVQKKLAANILGISIKRISLDLEKLEELEIEIDELKQSITKDDIRRFIKNGVIKARQKTGTSRSRARKILVQKRKGRRTGEGSRKGKSRARLSKKDAWMNKIRPQREFLKDLKSKDVIDSSDYQKMYRKAKGGFFRSKRHIKLYLEEHEIIKNGNKKTKGNKPKKEK